MTTTATYLVRLLIATTIRVSDATDDDDAERQARDVADDLVEYPSRARRGAAVLSHNVVTVDITKDPDARRM